MDISTLQKSFNPCFSGSYIMTLMYNLLFHNLMCFNPCFSGSYIMTLIPVDIPEISDLFQSLF